MDFLEKPDPGQRPVTLGRPQGDREDCSNLFHREATEVTQFDNACLPQIRLCKTLKGGVHQQNLIAPFGGDCHTLFQIDALSIATSDGCPMCPRMIHEHPAHDVSCDTDKVFAVFPIHILSGKPEIRLMDQRSWLQGMVRPFASHISLGEAM